MERSASRRLLIVAIYASAMGWLEAVVVVYIRSVLGFPHGAAVPGPAELESALRSVSWLTPTEQGREAATLVMLGAVGWLAAREWRGRLGAFLVAFGVWDIVYYVGLYALLRWPPSLATYDLLFLIPPSPLWYQPVWVPVAISVALLSAGAWLMAAGAAGRSSQ
jgi:hypothetical protein